MVDLHTALLFLENPNIRGFVLQELHEKGLQNVDQEFIDLFVLHFFSFYERVNPEAISALEFLTPRIQLNVFLEHFDTFLNQYFTTLNQIFFYENVPLQDTITPSQESGILPDLQEEDETSKIMLQYDITELDAFYYLNFNLDTELETRPSRMQDPFQIPLQNTQARNTEVDLFNEFEDYEEDISEDERDYRKRRLYQKLYSMFTVFDAIKPVILRFKSLELMERMRFLVLRTGFRSFNLEHGTALTRLIVNIKHLSNTYFLCLLDFKEDLLHFLENDLQRINHFSHPDLLFNILYHSAPIIASTLLTKNEYKTNKLKDKKIIASPYSYLMFYRVILKHKIEALYEVIRDDLYAAKTGKKILWLYILLLSMISERAHIFINEIFDIFISVDHLSIRNLIRYFIINFSLNEESLLFFEFKYQQNPNAMEIINRFKSIIKEIDSARKDHPSDIIL